MTKNIKAQLGRNIANFPGYRTKKKIIVFQSDDWGSVRIPSVKIRNELARRHLIDLRDPFSIYDTLENKEDLEMLFELLEKFKDVKGSHPIFTANFVSANPNFEKIYEGDFSEYIYETIADTYDKYFGDIKLLSTIKNGLFNNIFIPQFHGREHLNVPLWISLLRNKSEDFINAFNLGTFAINYSTNSHRRNNIMAALDWYNEDDRKLMHESLIDGYNIFKQIFNSVSESFIAPCYVWDSKDEKILDMVGIKYIQCSKYQNSPRIDNSKYRRYFRYSGQSNNFKQYYIVRNCLFEPSLRKDLDWIDTCMNHISNAFFFRKPAVISTHRLNYVGSLDKDNRSNTHVLLKKLLTRILKKWPDVEFKTTSDLGNLFSER